MKSMHIVLAYLALLFAIFGYFVIGQHKDSGARPVNFCPSEGRILTVIGEAGCIRMVVTRGDLAGVHKAAHMGAGGRARHCSSSRCAQECMGFH